MGNVSVRTALNNSLNTVAVKVLSYVGIDDAKYYAKNVALNLTRVTKTMHWLLEVSSMEQHLKN